MDACRETTVVPPPRLAARYEAWVQRYHRRIYGLLWRLCGDPSVAEDLTQETFVQVWRGLPEFRGECRPETWIHRIALNVWRQHGRRAQLDPAAWDETDEPADPAAGPEERAAAGDLRERLEVELARLPEIYREVLLLHKVQGLTLKRTAAVLELPVGTVKWRVHEGLEMLRRRLGEAEDER